MAFRLFPLSSGFGNHNARFRIGGQGFLTENQDGPGEGLAVFIRLNILLFLNYYLSDPVISGKFIGRVAYRKKLAFSASFCRAAGSGFLLSQE